MKALAILLFPFTLLYKWITDFRNHLYNIGYKKSFQFDTKVINVGNLTVGGTGKTPHVEYLISWLSDTYIISTLSRGYGRKTKGFLIANEKSNPTEIGDEPMQFYRKFQPKVAITVGEERALAIPQILMEIPDTELIILDDAFQHRPVVPNINILLTDFSRLFYQDFPFPSGRLRESRYGAKRADIVIVSKCPNDLTETQKSDIQTNIRKYIRPKTPIFFTGIHYSQPRSFKNQVPFTELGKNQSVILVSGIAKAENLEKYVQEKTNLLKHFRYPDHYHYTLQDLQNIQAFYQKNQTISPIILCTEKDWVKLQSADFEVIINQLPFYYLPIEVYFLENEDGFKDLIINGLENK